MKSIYTNAVSELVRWVENKDAAMYKGDADRFLDQDPSSCPWANLQTQDYVYIPMGSSNRAIP